MQRKAARSQRDFMGQRRFARDCGRILQPPTYIGGKANSSFVV
ncbi:MAG TPA: hypothetical protein VKB58_08080 [Terriglobales bacterium]|nr:hypothetical protein [Terriglobales bacterium]